MIEGHNQTTITDILVLAFDGTNRVWVFVCSGIPYRLFGEPLTFRTRGDGVRAARKNGWFVNQLGVAESDAKAEGRE